MADSPSPVDIEHDTQRGVLTIAWADGQRSAMSLAYVRGWCPCAACQGHGNQVRFVSLRDPRQAQVLGIEEVGAYAIALRFADGHDSGIYRWSWLHTISAQGSPPGYKYGHFEGGVYTASEHDGPQERDALRD